MESPSEQESIRKGRPRAELSPPVISPGEREGKVAKERRGGGPGRRRGPDGAGRGTRGPRALSPSGNTNDRVPDAAPVSSRARTESTTLCERDSRGRKRGDGEPGSSWRHFPPKGSR